MKDYWFLLSLLCILILSSCRDDFETIASTGSLTFSKDTIYLDTIFTNISSTTYHLKVYNKSNKNIHIPDIRLALGEDSGYRLNADGAIGKSFQNIELLAKDSIYIFIEVTMDFNEINSPIYTDKIVFDTGQNSQEVQLVTLIQDAHFLYPSKNMEGIIETIELGTNPEGGSIDVQGFYLNDDTIFTDEKPYVIYGYCAVPPTKILTIMPGAKIYFHANSGLIIDENASLKIEGELNNPVLIEGDRLEPSFNDTPGQWGTIWLRNGSKNNSIDYTTIKNATIGILIDSIGNNTPTLTIKNSQLYNHANYGILGRSTSIRGENLVINNVGFSALACTGGGSYDFKHSTFANYWNSSIRQFPSVMINNFSINNSGLEAKDLKLANFTNCIIYGNTPTELTLDKIEGAEFQYNFKNNLIQYENVNSDIPEYDFDDNNHFQDNIFNKSPDFKAPYENIMFIGQESYGNGKGNLQGASEVPFDILGVNRISSPDIGAYQHMMFEK